MQNVIQAIARGEPTALAKNMRLAVGTRVVRVERSLAGQELDCVRSCHEPGERLGIVCDATTLEVLGERVQRALSGTYSTTLINLGGSPACSMATVELVEREIGALDGLIAVGSGTINDIAKYAAARSGKTYSVFATAPSMNGYVSANVAVYIEGLKSTRPARPPVGAFFDLAVLAASPARMIAAGLGDSLCRCTAQTDWLMSHIVRGTEYSELPYDLLMRDEDDLVAMAADLVRGDLDAMLSLVDTLVLAGFGMTAVRTSAPGSQGEHLISHYSDMQAGIGGHNGAFHGEQIAVTTLTMARIQDHMLSGPAPRLEARVPSQDDLIARFGKQVGERCWEEMSKKAPDADQVNQRLTEVWSTLQTRLAEVQRSPAAIARTLAASGAPIEPEAVGWSRDHYISAVRHAREIRDRYTFLDLAAESGLMDGAIEKIA